MPISINLDDDGNVLDPKFDPETSRLAPPGQRIC